MGIAMRVQTPETASGLIDDFVVSRIAAENGATCSELLRDLSPITSHRLSPSELRAEVDASLGQLEADGLAHCSRSRFRLSARGKDQALAYLNCRKLPLDWTETRDVRLVALALGITDQSELRIKSLATPEGLRAIVLQQAYGLPGRRIPSVAKLRCDLAVVALERAFGNKIKSGFESGKGLSAKAGRMLAGQLSQRPRDFGTDSRLIAALAAEACGSPQTDAPSLRMAILRNAFGRIAPAPPSLVATAAPPPPESVEVPAARKPAAATRPDLPGFAAIVLQAAEEHGEGWPGNKKAFVSRVWAAIAGSHPEWGLTEIEFKAMLTEAHRTGHLVLANADIKSKANAEDIQASQISYKNTVWHYVRVTE